MHRDPTIHERFGEVVARGVEAEGAEDVPLEVGVEVLPRDALHHPRRDAHAAAVDPRLARVEDPARLDIEPPVVLTLLELVRQGHARDRAEADLREDRRAREEVGEAGRVPQQITEGHGADRRAPAPILPEDLDLAQLRHDLLERIIQPDPPLLDELQRRRRGDRLRHRLDLEDAVGGHGRRVADAMHPEGEELLRAVTGDRAHHDAGDRGPLDDGVHGLENNWASGWTIGLFEAPECPEGTLESEVLLGKKVCSLTGEVTSDLTLVAGNYYKLDGKVAIGKDIGADGTKSGGVSAELTIEPGVTVFGESGNDYLVVMRGSDIHAVGTSSAPIIMTGRQDILGEADIVNTRGLWGGLVILGQAPINKCSFSTQGSATSAGTRVDPCEKEVEGSAGDTMGGELPNDSSGSLKYVRVQYAGYEVFPGNELNGITFGGVGNGTVVDYIQVHNNQDDCVEFFGGTVDVKHLICTGAGDDNLDIDWGYQGRMQYVLVQQSNGVGDHVVESDNTNADAAVAYLTEPRSNPIVANFTFLSSGKDEIFKLKEGVSGQYYNGVAVVKDGSTNCIETTFAETAQDGAVTPHFSMNSIAIQCNGFIKTDGLATVAQIEAIVREGASNLYGTNSGGGSYVSTLSGPVNGSAETAATVTAIPNTYNADGFFDTTDYIGAVKGATDTWYKNWTISGTIDVQ